MAESLPDQDGRHGCQRIELLPGHPELGARDLRVWVTLDDQQWRRVPVAAGRPLLESLANPRRPASEVLLLQPDLVRGVRLAIGGPHERPWQLAELKLEERLTGSPRADLGEAER